MNRASGLRCDWSLLFHPVYAGTPHFWITFCSCISAHLNLLFSSLDFFIIVDALLPCEAFWPVNSWLLGCIGRDLASDVGRSFCLQYYLAYSILSFKFRKVSFCINIIRHGPYLGFGSRVHHVKLKGAHHRAELAACRSLRRSKRCRARR